jgi:hypothetical protein
MDIKQITENWKEVLDAGGTFKSEKVRTATAVMLHNEHVYLTGGREMNETTAYGSGSVDPNAAGYAGNGEFHKIAIPMVRRTFPELIAHEIVGVQPMTGPVGLAFALRFTADQTYNSVAGTEVGHNSIDSTYTGSMNTTAGEELGSDTTTKRGLGIGSDVQIKELSMTVEKAQVEAKTRKLRSRWSVEVAQDLKAMHGLNLEEEMADVLAYEITAEIDRELMAKIRTVAAGNSASTTLNWASSTDFDGRWESEKYRNLYNHIIKKANQIAIDTRRGAGNFVVTAPQPCAALEATAAFTTAPVNADVNTAVVGVAKVGSLEGRMSVYRDTFATSDDLVIGYKGPSEYDTGVVYLPYIQLMASKAVFEDSFNSTIGLMSRYAIHDNIFGSSNYYIRLILSNFV